MVGVVGSSPIAPTKDFKDLEAPPERGCVGCRVKRVALTSQLVEQLSDNECSRTREATCRRTIGKY
jgi:hypothetical protein